MKANVQTIFDWLDSVAPFDLQEDFDNAGLQAGSPGKPVDRVLIALDVTPEVVQEAAQMKADLIISHHPLIFSPLKSLNEEGYVASTLCQLVRADISLISAHTNLDQSLEYSGGAAIAKLMDLHKNAKLGKYLVTGELKSPLAATRLKELISLRLKAPVLQFGETGRLIHTIAIGPGAYSEGIHEALLAGADALLTGEVRHHHAVEAASRGLILFEGGHYATEAVMLKPLADGLQKAMDRLKYTLQVHVSRHLPYRLE